MSKLAKDLQFIGSGVNLRTYEKNSVYILRNFENTLALSFASALLRAPCVTQKILSIRFEHYQAQKSNVEKWSAAQKCGFLFGVCAGVSLKNWEEHFGISERTVKRIYGDLGISMRIFPKRSSILPYSDWEKRLHLSWFQEGASLSEISFRALRHPQTIAKELGLFFPEMKTSLENHISYHDYLLDAARPNIEKISHVLSNLSRGFYPQTHDYNEHFILRSQSSTLPIALASAIIALCQEELTAFWRFITSLSQPSPLQTEIRLLGELYLRKDIMELAEKENISETKLRETLAGYGVCFQTGEAIHPRAGLPLELWEQNLIKKWQAELSLEEISSRLQRPLAEIERSAPEEKESAISHQESNILTSLQKNNRCKGCLKRPIAPPFEYCHHCLLQSHPLPEITLFPDA